MVYLEKLWNWTGLTYLMAITIMQTYKGRHSLKNMKSGKTVFRETLYRQDRNVRPYHLAATERTKYRLWKVIWKPKMAKFLPYTDDTLTNYDNWLIMPFNCQSKLSSILSLSRDMSDKKPIWKVKYPVCILLRRTTRNIWLRVIGVRLTG